MREPDQEEIRRKLEQYRRLRSIGWTMEIAGIAIVYIACLAMGAKALAGFLQP